MDVTPPLLAPLTALESARKSVGEYYAPMTADADDVVRVAAFLGLIERKALPFALYDAAAEHARFGALRSKVFDYFQSVWEHGLAAQTASTGVASEGLAERALAEAQLACDDAAAARASRDLFLDNGQLSLLGRELDFRYAAGGADASLPTAVRNLVVSPHDPSSAFRLLELCWDARRVDLIDAVVSSLVAHDLHPRIAMVFAGWGSLLRGDAKEALRKLQQAGGTRPTAPEVTARLTRSAQRLNAEIQEKLGDARATFTAYQQLNQTGGDPPDVAGFRRRLLTVAKLDVPELPTENRTNWVTMTGFPRSGTTLLENALGAHPLSRRSRSCRRALRCNSILTAPCRAPRASLSESAVFVEARTRYYDEMERRRKKPGAAIFVDKSPIRSADAGFMVKAFPEHRYIFSIRHPFDVVLSCFKQAFAPNMAMENFRTIEAAVNLYDFTMTQWFAAFSMDDARVHYLKYDALVTEFEPRMRGVLHFLGAEWNDRVLDFATAAGGRASLTPSYQKVRQGLAIGVQTSWRKYPFVFQTQIAAPLKKWADFFGYPSK